MKIERKMVALELKEGDQPGAVVACFSTFGIVDKDSDIVLASAFTDGQEVPLTWHHEWNRPVGKGVIRVDADRAVFDGAFFLETQAGMEAYKTVKAMGSLQEYSWGFQVLDSSYESRDGRAVRVIKQAKVYEVSPVLVGAGENTRTLAIKAAETTDPEPRFKAADFATTFQQALTAEQMREARWDMDHAWRASLSSILEDQNLDATGKISLIRVSGAQYIEALIAWAGRVLAVAAPGTEMMYDGLETADHKDLSYSQHGEAVLSIIDGFVKRSTDRADHRAKEGRQLSQANRERLATLREALGTVLSDIEDLLSVTEPPAKTALPLDYLERRLRASGIALVSLS